LCTDQVQRFDQQTGVHAMAEGASAGVDQAYLDEERRLSEAYGHRLRCSPLAHRLITEVAQAEARALDDNHVGTEHITLGLFTLGPSRAVDALHAAGVTRGTYLSVLDDEAGPSLEGPIPCTVRSMMICTLAAVEAEADGAADITAEHLLLGVIRESRRWAELHDGGPRHLEAAATSVGSSLAQIEDALKLG
jgi:ATP-dependent Clp protease ATP-binding subunit ClpA